MFSRIISRASVSAVSTQRFPCGLSSLQYVLPGVRSMSSTLTPSEETVQIPTSSILSPFSTPTSAPPESQSTSETSPVRITARLQLSSTPEISETVTSMLPLLRSQPPYFIQIHIQGRPYLVTAGDTIRLPFRMHGVEIGDVLRLDCATLLGTRDFVLKSGAGFGTNVITPTGSRTVTTSTSSPSPDVAELADSATIVLSDGSEPIPVRVAIDLAGFVPPVQKTRFLDDRLFICRAIVSSVETEPMRTEIKKKQRIRRIKQAKSKHRYTVLRISELTVQPPPETSAIRDPTPIV